MLSVSFGSSELLQVLTTGPPFSLLFHSCLHSWPCSVRRWLQHCVNSVISPAPRHLARFLCEFAINRFASSILCLIHTSGKFTICPWHCSLKVGAFLEVNLATVQKARNHLTEQAEGNDLSVDVNHTFRRVLKAYKFPVHRPRYVSAWATGRPESHDHRGPKHNLDQLISKVSFINFIYFINSVTHCSNVSIVL